jgi:OOP family OmpA-OmpF porin
MKRSFVILIVIVLFSPSVFAQIDLGGSVEDAIRSGIDNSSHDQEKKDTVASGSGSGATASSETPTLHMFGKYDFIAGEKILMMDDFSNTNVGDFPKAWKTNGSGEIVSTSVSAGHWLMIKPNTIYGAPFHGTIPENATLEFDMINADVFGAEGSWTVHLYERGVDDVADPNTPGVSGVYFNVWPGNIQVHNWKNKESAGLDNLVPCSVFGDLNKPMHIAIWRQGSRVRMWMNETKVYDLPQLVPEGTTLNAVQLSSNVQEEAHVIFTNMRLAEGAPDTRNSLLTEGRLTTTGITFDVGSDVIRPTSYGVLRSIADVLKENGTVRVKIIGHTDNDGKPDANLQLSKRRAASVKNALAAEFGIEAGRMTTDGKGASEPVTPNTTPEGKAGNRRVEFVKE